MKRAYKSPFLLVVQPTFKPVPVRTPDQEPEILGYVISIHDADKYHLYEAFAGEVFPSPEMAQEKIRDIGELVVEDPEERHALRTKLETWASGLWPAYYL
jgi:hypothetical protein